MNLYTKSYDPNWGRIVEMVVKKNGKLAENLKDKNVFKLILHEKGEIKLNNNGNSYTIKEPSLIFLSDKDYPDIVSQKSPLMPENFRFFGIVHFSG